MEQITIGIGGREFTFAVKFERDDDAGAPWDNFDGHGPVTDWETREKRPGELVLNRDGRACRFYDYAEAVRIAKRDGWNSPPYETDESLGQRAARAARADYEYLRAWCADEWGYVGVIVTLLDDAGEPTEVEDALWGVETFGDYHHETARQIADELAHGYGTRWDEVSRQTFGYVDGAQRGDLEQ